MTRAAVLSLASTLAAALAALACAGDALSQPAGPAPAAGSANACFSARDINGFNAPDDHTLYIRVGVHDVYRLDLTQGCSDLTFRDGIGLRSVPPGDHFICSPIQAEVVYRDHGFPERCDVTAIHKLSKADLAATPRRDLP
jgi:hypothetical protein